jgi:hypothetical protein
MKIAFVTEMGFEGKIPSNYLNMRTEFAWMHALNADHFNLGLFEFIKEYDHVFVIFPKGEVYLNSVGSKLSEKQNPISQLLRLDIINKLKEKNSKVHFVQEGPHWLWNDYEIPDQIYYYNMISSSDSIFCHNVFDINYYKGLFPNKPINTIQTLLIEDLIKDIIPTKENKTIIGGNFARWYGGFESYIIASNFNTEIWAQESHAKRMGEEMVDGIKHLQRLIWIDWMKSLSTFKYAVHLMPTVAAGTFGLNCAFFGIPCIGNKDVDTQNLCHPNLSIDVSNIEEARKLSLALRDDKDFYSDCSNEAKLNYSKYYSIDNWKENINKILKTL